MTRVTGCPQTVISTLLAHERLDPISFQIITRALVILHVCWALLRSHTGRRKLLEHDHDSPLLLESTQ